MHREIFFEEGTTHAKSVTTSAVLLTDQLDHAERQGCVIQNLGTGLLYLGFDNTVSASNGVELVADDRITINGPVAIWGISAGTSDTRIWELE